MPAQAINPSSHRIFEGIVQQLGSWQGAAEVDPCTTLACLCCKNNFPMGTIPTNQIEVGHVVAQERLCLKNLRILSQCLKGIETAHMISMCCHQSLNMLDFPSPRIDIPIFYEDAQGQRQRRWGKHSMLLPHEVVGAFYRFEPVDLMTRLVGGPGVSWRQIWVCFRDH